MVWMHKTARRMKYSLRISTYLFNIASNKGGKLDLLNVEHGPANNGLMQEENRTSAAIFFRLSISCSRRDAALPVQL